MCVCVCAEWHWSLERHANSPADFRKLVFELAKIRSLCYESPLAFIPNELLFLILEAVPYEPPAEPTPAPSTSTSTSTSTFSSMTHDPITRKRRCVIS